MGPLAVKRQNTDSACVCLQTHTAIWPSFIPNSRVNKYFESQFYRIWGQSLEILIIVLRSMGPGVQGQNFELLSSEIIGLFTPHHKHPQIFQINPHLLDCF